MKQSDVRITEMSVSEIIDNEKECPFPLEVIPNKMGINLCSVESVEWKRQPDGQLIDLTIKFIPNNDVVAQIR